MSIMSFSNFIPLISSAGLFLFHMILLIIFTLTKLIPLQQDFVMNNDGSEEMALQEKNITRIRYYSNGHSWICLILGIVYIFVPKHFMTIIYFSLSASLFVYLIFKLFAVLADRRLRYMRKPVILSIVCELIYCAAYFAVMFFFFPDKII